MNVFEENPYLWSPSSRQSNNLKVVRLELSDEKQKKLSVRHSNLQVSTKVPVILLDMGKSNGDLMEEGFMYFHKVNVELENTYIELMLSVSPQDDVDSVFEVYFNNGDEPSPLNHTIKTNFTCNHIVRNGKLCSTFFNESVLRTGFNYFGIMKMKTAKSETPDTFYRLFVKRKRCVYWNTTDLAWSTKGCWVRVEFVTVYNFIKRRCLFWHDKGELTSDSELGC